jgi:cell division septal protein FtsQ
VVILCVWLENFPLDKKPMPRTFHSGNARPATHRPGKERRRRAAAFAPANSQRRMASRGPRPAEVRKRRHRVLITLYAVLGAEIGFALLTSPALAIRKMRVYGLADLPLWEQEQTLRALQIGSATNWFRAPLRRMREDTRGLPWVRATSVERSYSWTLFARVTPRQPFLALKVGPTWYETDADGVPIRIARPDVAKRLPHVVLQQERTVHNGLPLGDPALTAGIQILQEWTQEGTVHIAKIVIDQSGNICLNMRDGMKFQIGQAEDVAAKIALVKNIYARDPGIGQMLASVNLSCPSAPACTPRAAQTAPLLMGPPLLPGNVVQ